MATQAALTAETIAGLRRASGRDHYSSESDDTIQRPSNRGSKLKRKAEFVHEGQLDRPNGLRVFKRRITHAGYQRTILKRNPKRYDEDGDELEDDEVDEEADAEAARRNPYSHIHIEEILAPLTSAAALPNHPSLSVPYTSKTLSNMTDQACSMLHRERKALYAVKNLLTKFRGDDSYMPCGALNSEVDTAIFDTEPIYRSIMTAKLHIRTADHARGSSINDKLTAGAPNGTNPQSRSESVNGLGFLALGSSTTSLNLPPAVVAQAEQQRAQRNVQALSAQEMGVVPVPAEPLNEDRVGSTERAIGSSETAIGDGNAHEAPVATNKERAVATEETMTQGPQRASEILATAAATPSSHRTDILSHYPREVALPSPESLENDVEADGGDNQDNLIVDERPNGTVPEDIEMIDKEPCEEIQNDSQPAPHRMTTRAQAQALSDNSASSRTRSASPASFVPPVIHPLYQMPGSAHLDRDLGLPAHEAEETRRILVTYVQKQEEVVRGAAKLYEGLLRADRMRKTVFKWCKAEGHIGEMSDGEDWYDKEEWGLEEDLKKGHDDEEEDVTTQGKKTRKTRAQ